MIIATAGHIDHGKTSLVKALTGVDTDRLPQEKARGISIDIGFAYWTAPDGTVLGFVDVPGHERFIHNMLAGVAAIDFALLVVAADDGVMPQTREHLHILELFSVPAGVAVVTKGDRVGPGRLRAVQDEVAALLAPGPLAGSPVLAACAPSGDGVPALRTVLAQAAARSVRRSADGRSLRFAIDRSFTVAGSGTVVTGTVLDGSVAVGDRLQVSPAGPSVRVRGLHQRGQAAERVVAGERCALNLVGADPAQTGRGCWLVAPNVHAPTARLDVRLRVLPGDRRPLRHWDPVHFHIGTADVLGRLVMAGTVVAPGAQAQVQLQLDKPVVAAIGDRFVVRDASAQQTLGGGHVLDPFARHPRGQREARAARLAALGAGSPEAAWACLLAQGAQGVAVQPFRRSFDLTPAAMRTLLERSGAVLPGGEQGLAFSAAQFANLQDAVLAGLRGFHGAEPHLAGMDADRLLRQTLPELAQRERAAILRALGDRGAVQIRGSQVRLPGHMPAARAGDEALWQRLQPLYARWGTQVPLVHEVAARADLQEAPLRDLLKQRAQAGAMVRVAPERYLPRPVVAQLAQTVVQLAAAAGPDAGFTLAAYRDAACIGRNLAIEVLEYFDRLGLTRRGVETRAIVCLDAGMAAALADPDWQPPRFTGAAASD